MPLAQVFIALVATKNVAFFEFEVLACISKPALQLAFSWKNLMVFGRQGIRADDSYA